MDNASGIRVFIVDDHQLVVDGIQSLLAGDTEIMLAGQTNNPVQVPILLEQSPADILLTDINMPYMSGVELTRLVKKTFPGTKVICISMFSDREVISEMVKAGVSGYILKNTGKSELITAIKEVYNGRRYFSGEITNELMKSFSDEEGPRLTNREIEIIRLIEKELSNKQIADKLFISERTVETHRKNIFRKTSSQNVIGLLKYAYDHKII